MNVDSDTEQARAPPGAQAGGCREGGGEKHGERGGGERRGIRLLLLLGPGHEMN